MAGMGCLCLRWGEALKSKTETPVQKARGSHLLGPSSRPLPASKEGGGEGGETNLDWPWEEARSLLMALGQRLSPSEETVSQSAALFPIACGRFRTRSQPIKAESGVTMNERDGVAFRVSERPGPLWWSSSGLAGKWVSAQVCSALSARGCVCGGGRG